ncbi:MAG: glycosyltransferase [Candidatus Binatus sp.]
MSTGSKISIAMAVYNGERFIREQLDSLVRQTRPPDELVVSDNASTDRTVEIVRDFAVRAPFPVRLFINDSNLGVSRNFERAMLKCAGEIIFLCDCDDVWYPEKIRIMTDALANSPHAAVAVCNADIVDAALKPLGETVWNVYNFKAVRTDRAALERSQILNPTIPAAANCLAIRAKTRDVVLPLPDSDQVLRGWFDRYLVWTAVLLGAGGILLVDRALLAFRQHEHNTSGNATASVGVRLAALWKARHKRALPIVPVLIEHLEKAETRRLPPSELRAALLQHWRTRYLLPKNRIARIPHIANELFARRYHRFSSGIRTAVKDLIFVH